MRKTPPFFSGWTPLLLTLALLAGCAPAATPAPTATNPPPIRPPVSTPTALPFPTSTLFLTPTNQTNCTDSALFLADVTIPDGAKLKRGETFTKTWQLKNTGTCTWNERYSLALIGGEKMDSPATIPLAETLPGKTLNLSIPLTAPTRDGAFTGLYELRSPSGTVIPVGLMMNIWVKITVGTVLPAQSTASTPSSPQGGGTSSCNSSQNAAYVNKLAGLINAARADAKLKPLSFNAQLTAAAQGHSLDMACNNFLDHRGSDGSWIGDRLAAAGYITNNYAEIIAIGSPQDAISQWQASPSHWNAVLDAGMTEFGLGYVYVKDSNFGGYFTVDLASP